MLTPIHRALGLEPGNITAELIEAAVDARVVETADLDWKRTGYDERDPEWKDEIAKDVAAMANTGGGLIVLGVDEDQETDAASAITPVEWNAGSKQQFLNVVYARTGPPVLGIEFSPVEVEGGFVVVIRIPDSLDAPHFARKGKGEPTFTAPVRNGPHTVFMGDREIEQAFRRRLQTIEDREARLRGLLEQASVLLDSTHGVCLAFGALPIDPSTATKPQPKEQADRYRNLPANPSLLQPVVKSGPFYGGGDVRKALRGWLLRGGLGNSLAVRKIIRDDGVVCASYRFDPVREEDSGSEVGAALTSHCMATDIEKAVADFATLVREHAGVRNVNSGYQVRATLLGKSGEPIFIRTNGPFGFPIEVERSEPIHIFQPVLTEFDPLAEVGDLVGPVSDLALDIINQGGLQDLQILAQPEQAE